MKNLYFGETRSFSVHTENDAYKLINLINDFNLKCTQFNCFTGNIVYSVYYDSEKSVVRSQAYPFSLRNTDIRQAFKDAIFAIYHTNFL